MLLPSDVARLVLGYLQQEKLASTCSAFIAESPNLKEYAEHYTDEGFVPGCLLSLFGKNLTAILNEYVTMKAKEMTNDVPLMISSLWKKLEFTLSQIRSMQNSAAFSANQRARTRSAIADMRRQKTLDFPSTSSSLSNQSGPLISRPLAARPVRLQCALRPTSIPLSISSSEATEKQPTTSIGDRSTVVPSHKGRKHSNMMSPGRRKIESQKRRPCSSARNLDHSNTAPIEEQSDPLQELIDGNFPKLVIESARDRFLSNKSLQEKLAENINKFLGSDANVAPAARPADSSAADADTAIDEILGLEGGEIHMSDEAIHDILQQTESDPAFQALFDLFDFGKTKEGKKTSTDTMSQNEDCLNPNTLEESYSDTLQNSFTIENVGEGNTQNATRDSSNQDEVNSMIVDNTFPETLDRSGNEIVDNHVEMAASNQDSGKLFSSVCKTQVNSADSEENNAQTTVCLHSEREVDKSSTELLPVQNHKQIGKIQESPLFEHDIPKSVPLQSRADEVGSQSAVSNSSPVSPVETATMMGNEKRKSISNEPSLHGLELNKTNISEHSGVMSDVEMKDISSSKDKRTDLECVPDILNIAPLSEDVQATPFVAEPVKLFNESGHEGSTTVNPSTDSSKDQTDGSETTPTSSQIVKPSSAHQMDTQISQVCSVDIPSQTEASCPPVSEEKQNQVAVSVPIDTSEPPVVDVVPHTSHSEEPAPLAAILKESLPSADVCTDKETISHATSSIEEEHMVGSTQRSTVTSASSTCIGLAPENTFTIIDSSTVPSCAGNVPSSSSSQLSDVVDPSKIMSLKIIISEDSHLGDAELNNAVSSITGENLPTIVLSSPGKIQVQNVALSQSVSAEESVTSLEGIADVVFVDQCLPVHTFTDQASGTISFKADDGTVFSVAGAPSLSSDGGFLQLMPATSTAFGQSNSIYLTTCMSDNASFRNTKSQSKITPIAAKRQSQVHTPPRPRNVITVGQALSPKVSQGSTIIFASPVQPGMLQMGMIPLSVVGPNRNTYSTFPGQILQMPATSPLSSRGIPKLPIAPKNPKTIGSKSTIHTGRILKRKDEVSSHPVPIQPHRSEPSEAVVTPDGQKKAEEPFIVPSSAPSSSTKATGSHRRMLSFEDKGSSDPDGGASQVPNTRNKSQGKERPDSLLHSLQAAVGASQYIKIMQSNDNNKTDNNNSLSVSSVSQTDITATKMLVSSSTKDADPGQKVTISDSISDKTSANKENTLTRGSEQQHKQDAQKPSTNQEHVAFNYEKTVPLVKEMSRKGILPNILRKSPLDPRKEVGKSHLISPLSKQAAEMLQGIQMRSPTPKQTGDLPLPRTPGSEMNMLDGVRTPTSKTTFEEGGTPRALLLPATPEMQGCSPASEAGSENSVSMAAHTLMILSRASIANTGNTPLKDNTQHVKSRSTVKKRKLEETEECERQTRLSKKELQSPQTPLKKKKKKTEKQKVFGFISSWYGCGQIFIVSTLRRMSCPKL